MAGSDLNSLNPNRFSELLVNREKAIARSSESPKACEPAVNKLAHALHPKVQHLVVADIIEHNADTKSYICKPDQECGTKGLAYFSAGQYLSVSVIIDGQRCSRPYSISSSPRQSLNGEYRLTVKRAIGGKVSNFILDNFDIGTRFDASDPAGSFTFEPLRDAKHIIALAGGSGITPFISMAKAIAENDEDFCLTILYGSRTASDILFADELNALSSNNKINVVYVLSDESRDGYEHGIITSELVKKHAGNDLYSVFVCGNQAMTSYLSDELSKLGLKRKYIRFELRGETASVDHSAKATTVLVTVRAQNGTMNITGKSSDSILRILESAGITPPTSCRSGECGFCRSKLISGEVYIPQDTDKRRMADRKFGYIHPCCTYACGDIEIEVSAKLPTEE